MPHAHFARQEGVDDRRAQLIWDGVALNSTPSIALYKETEIALATMGIGLDWGGWGYEALTVDAGELRLSRRFLGWR